MVEFHYLDGMTDDELLREEERLLGELSKLPTFTHMESSASIPVSSNDSRQRRQRLFNWYRARHIHAESKEFIDVQRRWLDSVYRVVTDIDSCLKTISSAFDYIGEEKLKMISELSGLDEKSKKLLDEQSLLEREVADLELELNSKNVIRNVDSLGNQKEILIFDFGRYEAIVASLELVRADPRQYEHLKSKVCSIALSVGTAAVEVYSKRMLQYIDGLEGGTLSSVSLFSKFTETLQVVGRISTLFRTKEGREYFHSLSELEKTLSDARQRICVPVVGDYVTQLTSTQKLSQCLRKGIYFVNSIGKQEQSLFESVMGSPGIGSDSFHALLRSVGLGFYYPLRTAIIGTADLAELRESAEILRLEIFSSSEYVGFIQSVCLKLQRDIQERLIYRVEFFIRDEIRGSALPDPSNYNGEPVTAVVKTYECLDLLTGVVDTQTFHEMANEAVTACIDALMGLNSSSSNSDTQLFLIAQLLAIRERITLIDCEYSLHGPAGQGSVDEIAGLTDQIKRLVVSSSAPRKRALVRLRIEAELKSLCEAFNAGVIAKTMSLQSDDDQTSFLRSARDQVRKSLKTEGLDLILTRPILVELERMGVSPQVISVLG